MSDLDEFLEIAGTEPRLHYHFYTDSDGQVKEVRLDDHKIVRWPVVWKLNKPIADPEKAKKMWWKKMDELNEIREACHSGKAKKIVHKCEWL